MGEQDPAIEPLPYKIYTTLEPIPLPRDFPDIGSARARCSGGHRRARSRRAPCRTWTRVARLCLRSNGLLKRWRSPSGREIEFRAAGCTGARYHLELYLVCGELPGLEAGVYQYAAHDHSLRQLRAGDYRAAVVAATGQEPAIAAAPVIAIWTSTFWRNAWRYQARAYRHVYWDTATALANLLAVAADAATPSAGRARVRRRRDQRPARRRRRAGGGRLPRRPGPVRRRAAASPAIAPLGLATLPLSEREIVFPEIGAMHAASSLDIRRRGQRLARRRVRAVRSATRRTRRSRCSRWTAATLPTDPIDAVIERRRSNRHYAAETPISFAALSTMLIASLHGTAMDCLVPGRAAALHPLPHRQQRRRACNRAPTSCIRGASRRSSCCEPARCATAASRLACDQDYAADAHVNAYALTDLEPVLEHFGNRGYRLAQLEAALFGAKLQLAAHALGLGRGRLDLLRRRGHGVLLPARRGQELHVHRRLRRPAPPIDHGSGREEQVPATCRTNASASMTRRVTLQYARAKTTRRSLIPPQTMHRPDAAIARKLAPPAAMSNTMCTIWASSGSTR